MTDVLMPRLSDSMEEGTILTWLAADGDDIVEGQELVEVETDKATMTQLSEASGVLSIVVAEGTTIAVGEVIARLEPAGARAQADTGVRRPRRDDAAARAVHDRAETTLPSRRRNRSPRLRRPRAAMGALPADGTSVPATPMARRIADVHGVDLASLTGSGPRGRVVRADVMAAAGLPDAGRGPRRLPRRRLPRPSRLPRVRFRSVRRATAPPTAEAQRRPAAAAARPSAWRSAGCSS